MSEPNYHTAKFCFSHVLAIDLKKKKKKKKKKNTNNHDYTSNVWVLVWLHETKIWRKSKIMLNDYR